MCRSIKTLYNFEPPVTEDEVKAAADIVLDADNNHSCVARFLEAALG